MKALSCLHYLTYHLRPISGTILILNWKQWVKGLFIIVYDRVHEVHHGFGGTEYALHLVQPSVALKESL